MATGASKVLDLSVIIVNYNVRDFLEQALRSVQRAADGMEIEVFVVDNNSADGSVEMVRSQFPDVKVIANDRNVGFSKANNQAIRHARGRYLLILNPDTIVQEDTLSTLVRFMDEHPEAGAVGCKILNPDGSFALESRRAFPTPSVAFFRMIGLSRLFPGSRLFGRYNLTYLPIDQETEVDALSGSCMLVRHAALYMSRSASDRLQAEGHDVDLSSLRCSNGDLQAETGAGLFDEKFFMYGEDLDWCYRIQQAGWKIYYTPETQIIHYKGESTKKGELRYVRLFYGAMLRFAEKHFHSRYSRVFIWLLRLGVFARAGLTVLGNTLRRLSPLLLDLLLVFGIVALLGLVRSAQAGVQFAPTFYGVVAPLYALATVMATAAVGGYRHARRGRLLPVWIGATVGMLFISSLSFFARDIAFSRAVVLAGFVASATLLSAVRLVWRSRRREPRRALLVGHAAEACRLHDMLASHPDPPFQLAGYVDDGSTRNGTSAVARLGSRRHLRDLVRLQRIDDVVFAACSLSNRDIFRLMQQLRDLPVQFRILGEGHEHVIGKASIDDLSAPPLIEAERALGTPRSHASRRAFDIGLAIVGLLLHPVVRLAARLGGPASFWHALALRTREMPAVLAGRRSVVGYRPDEPCTPPPEWDLPAGVFSITDALAADDPGLEEANRAYWFYLRNQSASLDWMILVRSLQNLRR